jgi:hypothetical protein
MNSVIEQHSDWRGNEAYVRERTYARKGQDCSVIEQHWDSRRNEAYGLVLTFLFWGVRSTPQTPVDSSYQKMAGSWYSPKTSRSASHISPTVA